MLVPVIRGEVPAIAILCVAMFRVGMYLATHIGMLTGLFPPRVLASAAGIAGVGEGCVNMVVMLATGIVWIAFRICRSFIATGFYLPWGLCLYCLIRRIELLLVGLRLARYKHEHNKPSPGPEAFANSRANLRIGEAMTE